MALNRGASIEKLKKYKEEKARRSQFFYRPKNDEQRIRVIPSQGEELFFYESGYHKLGETFFNCPAFDGSECPVCKKVRELYNGTQEQKSLAEGIRVRKQYYYNVIVRDDEFVKDTDDKATAEPNVKIMQVGIKLHNLMTNAILDSEIGDITDVDKGYDVIIRRKTVDNFPNYDDSTVSRKQSKLFEDENMIQYCLNNYKKPVDYIKYPSSEELAKNFEHFLEHGYCPTQQSSSSESDKGEKEESPKDESNQAATKEEPSKEEPKQEAPKEEPKQEAPKDNPKPQPQGESKPDGAKDDYMAWQEDFEKEFQEELK